MANTLHMETDSVREIAHFMLTSADGMIQEIDRLHSALIRMDWQSPSRDDFEYNFQTFKKQFENLTELELDLGNKLLKEVDEWELIARDLAVGDFVGNILSGLNLADQVKLDDFIQDKSWKVTLSEGGKPIIIFADGRQLDLGAVQNGDMGALTSLGDFLEQQSMAMAIGEQVAKGKWVEVSGYLNGQSGNWVESYLRTMPGGKALGDNLGNVGLALETGDAGLSLIAALTENKQGEWVEIPLGMAGDKPIVYSMYVPPKDNWREFWTKVAGIGGGAAGTALGTAAGTATVEFTGPVGPVAGGLAGNYYGGEASKSVAGMLYDSLVPKSPIPQNPLSNMIETGMKNSNSIYLNTNSPADVIDLARIVQPGNGQISTQLEYKLGRDGISHLQILTTPTF